jgi:hypothetical protein
VLAWPAPKRLGYRDRACLGRSCFSDWIHRARFNRPERRGRPVPLGCALVGRAVARDSCPSRLVGSNPHLLLFHSSSPTKFSGRRSPCDSAVGKTMRSDCLANQARNSLRSSSDLPSPALRTSTSPAIASPTRVPTAVTRIRRVSLRSGSGSLRPRARETLTS